MVKKVVIIGAGGNAREILDILDACNQAGQQYDALGYVVDPEYGSPGTIVNGKPILGDLNWLSRHRRGIWAVCSVAAPELRLRVVTRARKSGIRFCSVIHPSVILTRWVTMGEGVVIAAGCVLTNQIRLGDQVQINVNCSVSHDTVLGDYVTLAPGVHLAGLVAVSTGCHLGTGANVIDRLHLGEWSIVGAGSAIVKDVPPNATVAGVPGRVIKTREAGWHLEGKQGQS